MKLLFFEEELILPASDVNFKIYTKEMVEDLKDKKVGVILGNNGYKTMVESMKKAINENFYAIITNQIYLLNLSCFIDEDGTRDIYMASLKNGRSLDYVESYLNRRIARNDNLEEIYRNSLSVMSF